MKKLILKNDIKLFGVRVETFPSGVGEAFETLAKTISEQYDRSYYGLSQMSDEGIVYRAAAEEKNEGEAEKYKYERFTVDKGEYLIMVIKDWRKNLECIKDVFGELMRDKQYDNTKPCIEWYKDDEEMLCMVKSKI